MPRRRIRGSTSSPQSDITRVVTTNHIAPSFTAGTALQKALAATGDDCTIMTNADDLSWGPIDAQSLHRHASGWWFSDVIAGRHHPWMPAFGRWDPRFIDASTPTVFWFGGRSAEELCSLLCFASTAEGRPWSLIDVTENSGSGSVSATAPSDLSRLVDTARPVDTNKSAELAERWRTLQHENAPFRVLTGSTLTSAPEDHFDELLLQRTPMLPTPMSRVIAEAMGANPSEPVADYALRGRLIALISEGKIAAEGNPSTMESCLIYRASL